MTRIIAHRGSSYMAPENTLAAVELAWQEGADAVEVDVRLTADGRIVAVHDEDLRRTAGSDARVDALAFSELAQFDVGRWKGERYAGERIPTLEALLATMPSEKRFFVELKCGAQIDAELARVVLRSPSPPAVIPIGFELPLMRMVKRALPMCKVYGVFEFDDADEKRACRPTAEELIAMAREHQLDGIDMDARGLIDSRMVGPLKSAGLDVCVWTVDATARARELIAAGVDGITTNRPGWLRSELGL